MYQKYISTTIKYLFSFIFILLSYKITRDPKYVLMSITELVLIFSLSDYLVSKSKWYRIINSILMLAFNLQICVLYFGNSFITYIMVESLYNLKDLAGKAIVYSLGVLAVLIFSFLPIRNVEKIGGFKLHSGRAVPVLVCLEIMILITMGSSFSPFAGWMNLYNEWQEQEALKKMVLEYAEQEDISSYSETAGEDKNNTFVIVKQEAKFFTASNSMKFFGSSSDNDVFDEEAYIASLPFEEQIPYLYVEGEEVPHDIIGSNVNVILIFTEGLSKNIISDKRMIMPNVAGIMNNSINFTNYYNHTFATYRGLQGQLYSGNSLNDQDTNSLTSMMVALRANGYYTEFYNTEPYNEEFTTYLNAMSFDNVVSEPDMVNGMVNSVSDKDAYQRLYENAVNYKLQGKKFFLAMYTLGTHASLNSVDEMYGDALDPLLNKFYNADVQFGKFFANYLNSGLADDTIIVFTTDHATYADEDFVNSFPGYYRANNGADQIPFFIYYKGKKMTVDADGRNSLDMAPTVLDLLGVERPDNFLGYSLFEAKYKYTIMDTFFWNPGGCLSTGDNKVKAANGQEKKYVTGKLAAYFSKK